MHDFYSDTKSKPTEEMRRAVLTAEVGDEQKGEDPTTAALEARVAALLGHEAAVFLPSGTLCNEIAIRIHCRDGDEIICHRESHIIFAEGGGPAVFARAMVHPVDGPDGTMTPEQLAAAIRPASRYAPASRLLSVEQTANLAGGAIWPLERLRGCIGVAKDAGLAVHMDGARLMNAVVATGIPASDWAEGTDTVWIDFTKGLGAPVGAVLAGSAEAIQQAWAYKQQMGGAMRQSGIVASMCLHALDHHVERLAEDHALAAGIAQQLAALPGVTQVLPAPTNIVIFDVAEGRPDAGALVEMAREQGVIIGAFGKRRIRVVTHLGVGSEASARLLSVLSAPLG